MYWDAKIEHQMERTYSKIMASKYFVLAPGASFYSKKWPIEYFMELVEKLLQKSDANIVIVGGQNDIDDANKLQMNDRIINFAGKVTLLESAIVLKNAEALVSNDSGVMHMAAAVGTPLIGIFGSTVEQFGFFPYRSKFKIIENEGLNCRPCSHVGKDFCPKGHFRCMLELHPQKIYDALIHLI
ncbi:MAG: glycosyltransferase family 9 protein [Calditrichaceae bacterium]